VGDNDFPDAPWTAYIRRRFQLDTLFANHDVLMTGRIVLPTACVTASVWVR